MNTVKTSPRRTPEEIHEQGILALRHDAAKTLIKGKMYLRLFHGRQTPDEELDGWGSEGPTFGPLDSFHATYLTTFNIYRETDEAELFAQQDLFVFEGKYYGDMSIFIA